MKYLGIVVFSWICLLHSIQARFSLILGESGELVLHSLHGQKIAGSASLARNSAFESFRPISGDTSMYPELQFSLHSRPVVTLGGSPGTTQFLWDNSVQCWTARDNRGRIWYIHFNEDEFSFSSHDHWFFLGSDNSIILGTHAANRGNEPLHLDRDYWCLYDPRTQGNYVAFSYTGSTITGYSFVADHRQGTVVNLNTDDDLELTVRESETTLTLPTAPVHRTGDEMVRASDKIVKAEAAILGNVKDDRVSPISSGGASVGTAKKDAVSSVWIKILILLVPILFLSINIEGIKWALSRIVSLI